jgi:hypothetical protein
MQQARSDNFKRSTMVNNDTIDDDTTKNNGNQLSSKPSIGFSVEEESGEEPCWYN